MNPPLPADSSTPPGAARKPRVLLYGNCQGWWYAHLLKLQPVVTDQFEIVYLANFGEWPADHPIRDPEFLSSCAVVLWQTAAGCKPPELLGGLSAGCRQIRFPTLSLKLLWPLHATDPRNAPEPGFPYGRYSYGDKLLMRLLDQGVTIEDLPRRYVDTDLNTIVNLDRYAEMAFAELRFNDRQSDIAITPWIENSFRERRLFHTINHASFALLDPVYKAIESALLNRLPREQVLLPSNANDYFGDEQIPLHPQIIAHFKLAWASPAMKWRYHSAFLSLEDYIRAYGAFTPIPGGNPPQLWLERAQQAAAQNDLAEAQRILLDAAATHPGLHPFLQFLGTLLIRANQLTDAEKVLRYAISQHPRIASLHNDLGVLMLRHNCQAEAQRCFHEALRLDPRFKDAQRNLILAAGQKRVGAGCLASTGSRSAA